MNASRTLIVNLCKYGFAFGLLAFVIWRNWSPPPPALGLSDILQRPLQWLPLFLAVLICAASILLTFLRWFILVRAQELPFTLTNALRLGMIGLFWSTFFPGSVGGDVVKAVYIAREQRQRTRAVATVLLDRVIGLWGLFWLASILGIIFWTGGNPAIASQPDLASLTPGLDYLTKAPLKTIVVVTTGLVTITTVVWIGLLLLPPRRAQRLARKLERVPKIGAALSEFWHAVWMYRNKQAAVGLALAMSIVGHVGFVMTFYFSAQVFLAPGEGQIPSLAEHFLVVPMGMTFQAVIPLPGGLGFGEMGYGTLYELVGKSYAAGVAGALAQRIVMWGLAFLGYFVYLRMPRPVTAAEVEAAEESLVEEGLEPTPPAQPAAESNLS